MKIYQLPDGDTIHHYKKSIVVLFADRRHVISTGPNNGGYREDLQAVFNHDDNPGPGMACIMRDSTFEGHMNLVALEDLGLNPEKCTGLCTAANMDNVSVKSMKYRDLIVTAIVTAGIEHNGGRAGDPATYYEDNEKFYDLTGKGFDDQTETQIPGTINVILHMNANLDAGTLARTIITVTEAKAAVLQELRVRSHNSNGLATGSGTDGIIAISNPSSSLKLTNAGKNSKLGELIGKTVMAATKEALFKQSGLCPEKQRNVLRIMGRYGINDDYLWEEYQRTALKHPDCDKSDLDEDSKNTNTSRDVTKADFIDRLDRLKTSPEMVKQAFLYAHIMDLLEWGLVELEEAEQMAEGILPGTSLTGGCNGGQARLTEKYVSYLIGRIGEFMSPSGGRGSGVPANVLKKI